MNTLCRSHTRAVSMNVRQAEGSFTSDGPITELHDCGCLDESWHFKPCLCHPRMWVEIARKHSSPLEIPLRVKSTIGIMAAFLIATKYLGNLYILSFLFLELMILFTSLDHLSIFYLFKCLRFSHKISLGAGAKAVYRSLARVWAC